jgi:CRISPR type III-associated protein (TIGR04423 family)
MDIITVHDIPRDNYEGYLWYSDETKPLVYIGNEEINVGNRSDAFIVEGLLWCPKRHVSYKILYLDGQQLVCMHQVSDDDLNGKGDVTLEEFITHRISGVLRLSFIRYWFPEKDDMCENYSVLVPGKMVFVGFNNLK